jgi:hemoglobin-like flavoprotein
MSAIAAPPGTEEAFAASLGRVTSNPHFADVFYARFLASSPSVAAVFAATDVAKLKRKLRSSLRVMTLAAENAAGADPYLGYLGAVHTRLHIRPAMYDAWLDALVAAVAECDRELSPAIGCAWEAIGAAVERIKRATQAPDRVATASGA